MFDDNCYYENSIIMVLCENVVSFLKFNQNFVLKTTIINLFTDQSEVSVLPAGFERVCP